jgi:hypothetical protein
MARPTPPDQLPFEPRIMQFDLKMVYRRHRAHAFLSNPAL